MTESLRKLSVRLRVFTHSAALRGRALGLSSAAPSASAESPTAAAEAAAAPVAAHAAAVAAAIAAAVERPVAGTGALEAVLAGGRVALHAAVPRGAFLV